MISYSELLHRIQTLPPIRIYDFTEAGFSIIRTDEISTLAEEIVIRDSTRVEGESLCGLQILEWGRLCSHSSKMVDIAERKFRKFKAEIAMDLITQAKDGKGKAPTEKQLEAAYRDHPLYESYCEIIECTKESFMCCQVVVDALKAKRDMLRKSPSNFNP